MWAEQRQSNGLDPPGEAGRPGGLGAEEGAHVAGERLAAAPSAPRLPTAPARRGDWLPSLPGRGHPLPAAGGACLPGDGGLTSLLFYFFIL